MGFPGDGVPLPVGASNVKCTRRFELGWLGGRFRSREGVPSSYVGCACHALHREERNPYSARKELSSCGLGHTQSLTTQHETFPKTPSAFGMSFCRFEDTSPMRPCITLARRNSLDVTASLNSADTFTSTQVFMAGRYVLCQHIRGLRPLPKASFSVPVNSRPSRHASNAVRGSGVGLYSYVGPDAPSVLYCGSWCDMNPCIRQVRNIDVLPASHLGLRKPTSRLGMNSTLETNVIWGRDQAQAQAPPIYRPSRTSACRI
ncbi:hypothetical protein V8D89_004817 [Ganoderma adspersum]